MASPELMRALGDLLLMLVVVSAVAAYVSRTAATALAAPVVGTVIWLIIALTSRDPATGDPQKGLEVLVGGLLALVTWAAAALGWYVGRGRRRARSRRPPPER